MKAWLSVSLLAPSLAAVAPTSWIIFRPASSTLHPPGPLETTENPSDIPRPVSQHVSDLVARKKIDPKLVIPLGKKSFSIVRTGPLRPDGDALSYVHSLIRASQEGDAVATFQIFLATLDCKRTYANSSNAISQDEDDYRQLSECEGLLTDPSIADADWLTSAADQGGVEAMILYSLNPSYTLPQGKQQYLRDPESVRRWQERSRSYLEQAVSLGSQDAMLSLSIAYSAGTLVDKNPTAELAYALAAQKASPIPGFQEAYEPLKNSLNPTQRQQAEQWANAIHQ